MNALEEGGLANKAGVPAFDCPYAQPPKRTAWYRGWYEAERDRGHYDLAILPPPDWPDWPWGGDS